MGLDEQICTSLEEYRDRAIEFVKKPEKLSQLRQRVRENHDKLFNTKQIVSELEAALVEIIKSSIA